METLKKWRGEPLFLSGFCFLVYRSKGLAGVTGKLWTTHYQLYSGAHELEARA